MYFKQSLDEQCGCASYLVASRQSQEAAIVDPSIETQQYEELLRERNFQLRYVIDTARPRVGSARASGGPWGRVVPAPSLPTYVRHRGRKELE